MFYEENVLWKEIKKDFLKLVLLIRRTKILGDLEVQCSVI